MERKIHRQHNKSLKFYTQTAYTKCLIHLRRETHVWKEKYTDRKGKHIYTAVQKKTYKYIYSCTKNVPAHTRILKLSYTRVAFFFFELMFVPNLSCNITKTAGMTA